MDIPIISQNIRFPGYGMFWVANSISSTLLGWNNRRLQDKAHERNQEFLLEMERARRITDDERMQEDINILLSQFIEWAKERNLMQYFKSYKQWSSQEK